METFDFVIIGAGPAGEAAAYKARELGASVAVVDRRWFGGSCPHIGCLPSKSLLDGAARHAANPATYHWADASAQRDYMVNRPAGAEEPDDSSHVRGLRDAGAVTYRGSAGIVGVGRVNVSHVDGRPPDQDRDHGRVRERPGIATDRSARGVELGVGLTGVVGTP